LVAGDRALASELISKPQATAKQTNAMALAHREGEFTIRPSELRSMDLLGLRAVPKTAYVELPCSVEGFLFDNDPLVDDFRAGWLMRKS
jgi:hypothetical protein